MKHFSHFVRPGATRLHVAGCLAGNAVAFEDAGGSRVSVIANPLKVDRPCMVGDESQAVRVLLPAESISTVVLSDSMGKGDR